MGSKTRSAIRAYQIDNGLPVSGEPSRTLYEHLQHTLTARVNPAPAPSVDSASIVEIQTRLRDRGYNIVVDQRHARLLDDGGNPRLPGRCRPAGQRGGQRRAAGSAAYRQRGDSRTLTRAEVVRLQPALAERGYDTGPADGVIGPKVRGAIRTYQADASLPVTGEATRTLARQPGIRCRRRCHDDDTRHRRQRFGTARLLQIEGELQRRGYYVGEFDGVADDQLRTAIRAYQTDASLPVTGEANAALLESLNSSSAQPQLYQLAAGVGGREPARSPRLCRRQRSTAISMTRRAGPSRSTRPTPACRATAS